jgi:N6-L-threonylcarbamoyladenine synthase
MTDKVIMGIDTSNYTTSVALMYTDGELIANIKYPLPVKPGERGLRQSDAVFAHVKNLPLAMDAAREALCGKTVAAVGVSKTPRRVDGSYMPCFLAGVSAAESIGAAISVPVFDFSHQCGHIMAAIYSSRRDDLLCKSFCAFHISGGTTEMLCVKPCENGFEAEKVGGTMDLNAGQIIDRIGVYMGLNFPAGAQMERLALTNSKKIPKKKIKLTGLEINLSGLENMAIKLYEETKDAALTSAFVLDYIGEAISALSEAYMGEYGKTEFVYAGGVMSNSIIKAKLSERFDCIFAEPSMSADNAVGTAYLALKAFLR